MGKNMVLEFFGYIYYAEQTDYALSKKIEYLYNHAYGLLWKNVKNCGQ